jgi:hypothetical protein
MEAVRRRGLKVMIGGVQLSRTVFLKSVAPGVEGSGNVRRRCAECRLRFRAHMVSPRRCLPLGARVHKTSAPHTVSTTGRQPHMATVLEAALLP